MNRTLAALGLAAALVTTGATPASAASATKSKLVGPDAAVTCAAPAEEAWDGENINTRGPGKVTMEFRGTNKIATTVTLRRAKPNTDYTVKLIQGVADCHEADGVLRTDRKGNGSLTRIEWRTGDVAQTIIHTGSIEAGERWRAKKALKP